VDRAEVAVWKMWRLTPTALYRPWSALSFSSWPAMVIALLNISTVVRFEVFTSVAMKNAVFWDVAPCGYCVDLRFGEPAHAGSSLTDFLFFLIP
jgi:hypothetical protein